MADPRKASTRRAVLSYDQLKRLTDEAGFTWPDLLIKDYQGIIQDFIFLADSEDALEIRIEQNETDIEDLQGRVEVLESKVFRTVSTVDSLTALSFQVILCNNSIPIEIVLNPDAVKDDMIHVMRKNDEVEVIGLVNGLIDRTINVLNYSELYIYDGEEWSTI